MKEKASGYCRKSFFGKGERRFLVIIACVCMVAFGTAFWGNNSYCGSSQDAAAGKKFLGDYSGQTTDQLIALENEYRVDSLVLAFESGLYKKLERTGMDGLSEEEKVVLAVTLLDLEVHNGGYEQFFSNSSKKFVPMVVGALNRIGRKDVADLTQKAIDGLGIKGALTPEAIEKAMDASDDNRDSLFNDCDDKYSKIAGDLATPLFDFIKKNSGKIKF